MHKLREIDMAKKPNMHFTFIYHVAVCLAGFLALMNRNKTHKDPALKGLKGPFIILSNHCSFLDFAAQMHAFPLKRINWVTSIDEMVTTPEPVMRGLGTYPKRKFVPDVLNVKQMLYIIKKGGILSIFPEVRFSLAGINERADKALGKLIKKCNVPVVLEINHGHWLQSPQFAKHPYRFPKTEVDVKLLVSKEELETLTAEEIQQRLEDNFHYNDYEYQQEKKVKVTSRNRMKNIHKVLYKCPNCGTEYEMVGKGTHIECKHCGAHYEQDVYGTLKCTNGETKFTNVPDWYKWEREEVTKEVRSGNYHFEDDVNMKKIYRGGYHMLGKMRFVHDYEGMHVKGTTLDGEPFEFNRPIDQSPSVHIEYFLKDKWNKEKGSAVDFANTKVSYFGWLQTQKEALTKIHFATEALYDIYLESLNKN
ncbi:MAG: hypothetical protein MJ248_05065 [Bacilli bacterium]|nr:hypothetical protein [Bacilli bacterium]